MVVDGDPEVLSVLARGLAGRSIEVDAFADTSDALRHLDIGRYAAVIADQILPGALCGHEFLLAAQQVDPSVRTILMSGEDLTGRAVGLERFDATARKPITSSELARLIGC